MKKNKMMRIASVLLVAVLISTCAISGTFAKYITKVSGTDKARVAKWGILLTVNGGDAFADKYATHDDSYEGDYSVISSNVDKVVAPGTSSADVDKDNLQATVFGTPEVATRYTLVISGLKDVILPAGTYTDYTNLVLTDDGYDYANTFTTTADYTPVKWNLKVSNTNDVSYDLVSVAAGLGKTFNGFSFTDAQTIVETQSIMDALLPMLVDMVSGASNPQCVVDADAGTITISMDFDPNTEMDYTFELTWAWAFENELTATYSDIDTVVTAKEFGDMADTFLGNVAAGKVTAPEGVSVELEATLTASATQID